LFDRDVVLETAKAVFWQRGYKATSTEDLRLAMGIGRQSFYDTFGGKRQIYVQVLQRYNSDGIQACVAKLRTASSPLAALEELLLSFSKEKPRRRALGCMRVAAMSEFVVSDAEVARIGRSSSIRLESLLKKLVQDAKGKREVRASLNERATAASSQRDHHRIEGHVAERRERRGVARPGRRRPRRHGPAAFGVDHQNEALK
jgi:TetR/AcrR family transcriptional repressor of nem operon